MMPHLGVLSSVYQEAAWQIFDKDCLVRLGTVVAPRGTGNIGKQAMSVTMEMPDGSTRKETVNFGDIKRIRLLEGQEAKAVIDPTGRLDVGAGEGQELETTLFGGVVGIILDARGRPLNLPNNEDSRNRMILKWWKDLDLYPFEKIRSLVV